MRTRIYVGGLDMMQLMTIIRDEWTWMNGTDVEGTIMDAGEAIDTSTMDAAIEIAPAWWAKPTVRIVVVTATNERREGGE